MNPAGDLIVGLVVNVAAFGLKQLVEEARLDPSRKTCTSMRYEAPKRHRCRRTGFTLADMIITMLIIGILSAVAAPSFFATLGRTRVEQAATRIKADLGLARRRAISTSSATTVQFSPSTDDYLIPGMPDLNHPGKNYSAKLSYYPYNAAIVSASLGGDSDIQFDRYGQPDSGGTITVEYGAYTQTVTVNPDTGRATIP